MAIDKLPKNIPDIMTKKVEGAIKVGENETKEAKLISLSNSVWKEALNPKLTQADAALGVAKIMGNIRDDGGKSYGFKTVEEANAYNGDDKEQVDASLDVIATASYLAIANAPATEVVDITTNLGRGSARGVRNELPAGMVGLENKMVAVLVPDPEVQRNLSKIDLRRSRTKYDDSQQKADLAEKVINTARELNDKEDVWAEVVATYLYAEARGLEEKVSVIDSGNNRPTDEIQDDSPQAEYFRNLAEAQEREMRLKVKIEEMSIEELLEAFAEVAPPRERSPQLWEYVPPEWMGYGASQKEETDRQKRTREHVESKEWRKILGYCEKFFGAVYNKRNDTQPKGGYNNSPDQVGEKILDMTGLKVKDLAFFYEHPKFNLKDVMKSVMNDLLTPQVYSDEVWVQNGGGDWVKKTQSTTIYVFKEDGAKYSANVDLYTQNEVAYKKDLLARMLQDGVVPNESVGMMSLTLAMNIMEIGGVFSLADTKRKLGFESDAMKLIQRPENKFQSKLGSEIWGGPWSEYFDALIGPNKVRQLAEAERMGLLPKLLVGSFLNQTVKTVSGEMQMGDAIYSGTKIKFAEISSVDTLGNKVKTKIDDDLYFSWRKDGIKAGQKVLSFIMNGQPLEFKDFKETDNVVTPWREPLYNAIRSLRSNGTSLLPTSLIAGAIGGSVGLWPFAGPYLRFATSEESNIGPFKAATEAVRSLGLATEESNALLDFFGVSKDYFIDFNDRISLYVERMNPNSSKKRLPKIDTELKKPRIRNKK